MDLLSSNSLLMLQRSMESLWTRQTAILDNITNAETPGYKSKYVTFEEELRGRLLSAASGSGKRAAIREAISGSREVVHVAEDESTRMDGNGVNITDEALELSRTAYHQQYVMSAISAELAILRSAIRGQ